MEPEYTLGLTDYQAANLRWCLQMIAESAADDVHAKDLDTGDWCREILWMLDHLAIQTKPNGLTR